MPETSLNIIPSTSMPDYAPLTGWRRLAARLGLKLKRAPLILILDDQTVVVSARTYAQLNQELTKKCTP